jgi:hypothetical protein
LEKKMSRAGQANFPGWIKRRRIKGQFIARRIKMLESPAFRVLSLAAHRCLSRIEAEHCHHGGKENGRLPVTYNHFVEYGLHRHAIGPGLRELEALGFIKVVEHGVAGNSIHRSPNVFALTYLPIGSARETDDWARISTLEEATAIAKAARQGDLEKPRQARVRKHFPVPVSASSQCRFPPVPSAGFRHRNHLRIPPPGAILQCRFPSLPLKI